MDKEKDKLVFDELKDYLSVSKYLKEDSERKKNLLANEIQEFGEVYVDEIERKKKKKKLIQKKLIPYILKYRGDVYNEKDLLSYSFNDVQEIYNEIKTEKKPAIIKFIHFIFNME